MSSPKRIDSALIAVLSFLIALCAVAPKFLAFGVPIIGAIFFIWNGVQTKQWRPDWRLALPFAVIGGLALLSSIWAIHPSDAVERAGKAVGILLGGIGLLSVVTIPPPNLPPLQGGGIKEGGTKLIPLAVLFVAALMTTELIFDFPVYHILHPDKAGTKIPDAVANRSIIVAILLAVPAFALAKIKWGWKKSALVFAPVFGTLFIVTESQSAQLGMIVGLTFAFLFPYRWKAAWVALCIVIIGSMVSAPFIAPYLFQHFAQGAESVERIGNGSANMTSRLEIWDFVSRRAMQHPFHGFGFEATRDMTDFDTKQLYYKNTKVLHPHNAVLQIWIEFGATGIMFAAIGFTLLLQQIYKTCSTAQARIALPTLMSTLTVGAISYGLWQGWWLGLLLLTAAVTIIALKAHSPEA